MTHARAGATLAMLSLLCGGCLGLFDDPPHASVEPRRFDLAVGANVVLSLGDGQCSSGTSPSGCLSHRLEDLVEVTLEGQHAFVLGEPEQRYAAVDAPIEVTTSGHAVLRVRYRDGFGDEYVDSFDLFAYELTRVELELPCRSEVAPGAPLLISAGAQFGLGMTGFGGDRALVTGDLPLLQDTGGFVLSAARELIAPAAAGEHVLVPRGRDSEPLRLQVFTPAEVELTLSSESDIVDDDIVDTVRVSPAVDGVAACVLQGSLRANVRVEQGDCAVAVGGFAIDGDVPVDVGEADVDVPVRGTGACELVAATDGGAPRSITLAPRVDFGGGAPWQEQRLQTAPVEVAPPEPSRSECSRVRDLNRGGCHILDAAGIPLPSIDCLQDWDWAFERRDQDFGAATIPSHVVGAGLQSELRAEIEYRVLLLDVGTYPPVDLRLTPTPADGLVAYADDCDDDDRAVVVVEHENAGDYSLEFGASNMSGVGHVSMAVHDVAVARFTTDAAEVAVAGDVTTAHVFAGVETGFAVAYEDEAGLALGGWGPVLVSTTDADARAAVDAEARRLHTGTTPNVIRLASPQAPSVYELDVVDATAIASVDGFIQPTLALGETECIDVVPRAADGRAIHGRSSTPPRLVLDAPGLVLDRETPWPDDRLCLRAIAAGTNALSLQWGDIAGSYTWTVQ
ncbi:MAG: hypothetical protein K1X88_19360 [Nannocystaceae bacterium]|nr:hypothetical protein [Nannocystaceae bacterium]